MMLLWQIASATARQIGAFALFFHIVLAHGANSPASAAGAGQPLKIVAFGDSLTAGYGLSEADAMPAKLEKALKAKGIAVEISNAGVSGDTTSGGLARLDWAVPDGTDGVIVALGANDVLRGSDPELARRNLDTIVRRIKAKGARVLLLGMRAIGNWGEDYTRKFEAIYPDLAREHSVALYPFMLEGVIGRRELSLPDGLHPNTQGVDEMVKRIVPAVEDWLAKLKK